MTIPQNLETTIILRDLSIFCKFSRNNYVFIIYYVRQIASASQIYTFVINLLQAFVNVLRPGGKQMHRHR